MSKLRAIAEVNRRDFLKQAGGGLLSTLLGKGVPDKIARMLVPQAGAVPAIKHAVVILGRDLSYSGPLDVLERSEELVKTLAAMFPGSKPRVIEDRNEEGMNYGVMIDGQSLARLLAQEGVEVVDSDDDYMSIDTGDDDLGVRLDPEFLRSFGGFRAVKDPIKTAWEYFGRWSVPEEYVNMEWLGDVKELMGVAKRYRLSPPEGVASWQDLPGALRTAIKDARRATDAWRKQFTRPEIQPRHREDPEQYRFAPPDETYYRTGMSGMHQSFEQRLRRAFALGG